MSNKILVEVKSKTDAGICCKIKIPKVANENSIVLQVEIP